MTEMTLPAAHRAAADNVFMPAVRAAVQAIRTRHEARKSRIVLSRLSDEALRDIGLDPFSVKGLNPYAAATATLMNLR